MKCSATAMQWLETVGFRFGICVALIPQSRRAAYVPTLGKIRLVNLRPQDIEGKGAVGIQAGWPTEEERHAVVADVASCIFDVAEGGKPQPNQSASLVPHSEMNARAASGSRSAEGSASQSSIVRYPRKPSASRSSSFSRLSSRRVALRYHPSSRSRAPVREDIGSDPHARRCTISGVTLARSPIRPSGAARSYNQNGVAIHQLWPSGSRTPYSR